MIDRALLRRHVRSAAKIAAIACAAVVVGALGFVAMPLPRDLLARRPVTSAVIVDANGDALSTTANAAGERSVPLANDEVPALVKSALIAAEDRRFEEHVGVDVRAMFRAARDSLRAHKIVSGASTIPQQLARRLVPRERTVFGKMKEALWALRLSAHLDKQRVLLEYANRIPLGNGTAGVEAASELYFDRPARSLSPAQAALLAGLAHAPAREDPFRHPERALRRRNVILARMHDDGFIDDNVYTRSLAEPLDLAAKERVFRAPHFAQAVRASLPARGLADAVRVETSLDASLQRDVEGIVRDELSGALRALNVNNAAVVVIDNATNRVIAYVGSRDFFDEAHEGQNDGARSLRQPGSALKPFAYGLALDKRVITPSTLLPDVETTLATESGTYAPRNYDKRVHGPVRARAALQNSYNIPAVHLAEMLGPAAIVDELHGAGFETLTDAPEHYGVGVILGDGDVTLVDMARAYAGLAHGGVVLPLVDVVAATDASGHALPIASSFSKRRFLSRDATALLTDILSDTSARNPAFGFDNALDLPFPVAAKTGTSRAYVDNWTAGFTKERTVAVWAGNFDGRAMKHVSGITGAGSIFRRVMMAAMKNVSSPAPLVDDAARARFETARICPLSGLRAGPSCPNAFDEHFLAGTAPTQSCTSHHVAADGTRALSVDARYAPWARGEGLQLVDTVPAGARASLLSPKDGDELVVEPDVPAGQAIPIKVRAPASAHVTVRVDDHTIELHAPFSTWIDTEPGTHTVALVVDGVEVERARVTVR